MIEDFINNNNLNTICLPTQPQRALHWETWFKGVRAFQVELEFGKSFPDPYVLDVVSLLAHGDKHLSRSVPQALSTPHITYNKWSLQQ